MTTYNDILKKLFEGNTVYILNRFYSTAIKCVPGTTHYKAKHKGGKEYDIESGTDLVYDSLDPVEEITKEEYDNY